MDAKILTGFLLWICLISSISISQGASARLDSRQRIRRQSDESVACPEGTKPCKDDKTMCATYCNGNPECADGSDELDCVSAGTTANDADTTQAGATVVQASTSVAAKATVVLADGTTIELPPGTTATISADDSVTTVAGGSETATEAVTGGTVTAEVVTDGTVTTEAVTGASEEAATGATVDVTGTTDDATIETSTIIVDNGTDIFTSAKPGNGHHVTEESSNDTTTTDDVTTATEGVSIEVSTIELDVNATTVFDNETSTESTGVTTVVSFDTTDNETSTENGTSWTPTIGTTEFDENATNITGQPETPVTLSPGGGRVELRVVVSPEILQVQRGRTYTLTCGVYGADASTTIYWIQEEPERRYALTDPADPNDKQITMSQVSLNARITIDDPSKIGKYTCMAQDAAGNSGSGILTMQEGGSPYDPQQPYRPIGPAPGPGSGYLRIVAPDMAEGEYVEIQCEGASPEDEGRIQWFFNNRQVNDEQPLYPRGKTLHIRPVSRPYLGNYRCSIPGSSYVDGNSVITFGGPVPSPGAGGAFSVAVDISQGQSAQGQALEGSQVVLRCRPSEQAASYRWTFVSSANPQPANRGYSDQLVLPRASSQQDSGVYTCEATSARGETARGSTNLYVVSGVAPVQPVTGRCSIDEATCRNGRCIPRSHLCDGKNDCGDNSDEACGRPDGSGADFCQPNEIQCSNAGRGRKCVQKFWMCDGDRDCDDGSDEEQRYCELLPRQRYCKPSEYHCGGVNATTPNPVCIPRSFQCDGYNDCPDRSDELGCVKPVVVAAPQRQIQINVGQTLLIQCTARGSPPPYINWRLNWGHVCGDGSDNGRCTMEQVHDASDPGLVTGTLTVRNVNVPDGGAYSCEALNSQGFIFAIPDAIVDVIIIGGVPAPQQQCNCNGHSSYCSPDGRCTNCQHNTVGSNCEFCAPGYQGDARRGTPYDCQPLQPSQGGYQQCDPLGTYKEEGGRCVCKYNVDGERCDRCKQNNFYLNPTTPNGCLPCFCSGVSTSCKSTDWPRKANALPLNNWNVVPKNFATDQYEGRDRIEVRNGGRELAIDQSSLGRPANEVLYWKAPKEALGDVVTLYDGNIDIHFTNDGQKDQPSTTDEFIWMRGNNIDLVHKVPQSQSFQPNTNATYTVQCNERTFTRKDGTYIDRENILMALSDLDTFLVKINPTGGRRKAVLRGVTFHVAARDGNEEAAPTVEACSCPSNYTGTSCEKCAEGYGRPHPLVGIYLGQCWSCRSVCHERSDRCDRETGKCSDCQGNSEGDRCERCRAGFVLDERRNQCVPQDQYQPYNPQPYYGGGGSGGAYYIDNRPYDPRGQTPLNVVLDGSRPEQRIPLQVNNIRPQSVVWGRTDGSPLPAGVIQEGNDLIFRTPSAEQAGNYICTITNPDGTVERVAIYLDFRPGQQPINPGYVYPGSSQFNPPSPYGIHEGENAVVQPQSGYYRVEWRREDGQRLPSNVYPTGNALQIVQARPDNAGTYLVDLHGQSGAPITVPYEIRILPARNQDIGGGPPKVTIEPRVIKLKEGQRMIVQYTVSSHEDIDVTWEKLTDQGYQPISSLFRVEKNRLVLDRATPDAAGTYRVNVRNSHGADKQELRIEVEPRRGRGRGQQGASGAPQIRLQPDQYEVGYGEKIEINPQISGGSGTTSTWSKDGSNDLPDGVTADRDGILRIEGRSSNIDGRYILDVSNEYGRVSSPVQIRWREGYGQPAGAGGAQDSSRSYINVRLESRDEQSHQVGRDITLQCSVHGSVERPYEYTYTKDGRPLENNVEVHPEGVLIIRNAQPNDAGRYQCEVTFPRSPQAQAQEGNYDLRLEGGYGYGDQGYQQAGGEDQQQQQQQQPQTYIDVSVEPSEVNIVRGEKANLTCHVKGTTQYKVTWMKYAHETSLPDYARPQGNNLLLAPTADSTAEQLYLQCQVDVPGQPQPYNAYAQVHIRGGDESSKKKKKRRS